jgi:hypothetical protein
MESAVFNMAAGVQGDDQTPSFPSGNESGSNISTSKGIRGAEPYYVTEEDDIGEFGGKNRNRKNARSVCNTSYN